MRNFLVSVNKGILIFSILTWLYTIANFFRDDFQSQYWDFSQYVPIHENVISLLAFFMAFVSFVLWDWAR